MTTQEDRLRAGRAVVARIISDQVRTLTDDLRAEIEPTLRPRETITAELPDGTEIGTVGRSKASQRPTVTDPDALLAWVREHRPDEIAESVKPAYVRHLEATCRKYGHAVDEATGEVIPGVEMVTGSASYRPAPSEEGRAAVLARLGEILGGTVPALPGGDS